MKRIAILSVVPTIVLIVSSFTYRLYHRAEERTVYTEWYTTPNLDQVRYGPGCDPTVDGNSCYKATNMTLRSTDSNWALDGEPTLECNGGVPQGSSAQWNHLDRAWQTLIDERRITVLLNNPDQIQVKLITGSGAIQVRLRCNEHTIK